MEDRRPRSRKKRSPGVKGWASGIAIAVLTAALAFMVYYIVMARQYREVFFPHTTINGMDASKKTVDEMKQLISSGIDGYTLAILERDGKEETIRGTDIDLKSVFDGSLEKLLEEQKPGDWLKHWRKSRDLELDTLIQFDGEKLKHEVESLACMDEAQVIKPQPASISDYVSGKGYSVIPAVMGTEPDKDKLVKEVANAVTQLKPELSLEDVSAYEMPGVPTDDPGLADRIAAMNRYVNTKVTYTFGNRREVLSGDTIKDWLEIGEDGNVYISSGAVTQYVKRLATKYDTYNKAKMLNTSYGKVVRITGGSYGWRIDQTGEANELAQIIKSGESQTREPVYKQKAASHGDNDYGSTYVEINLTAQHLYYYKAGSLVVDTDFVSGRESRGWSTPAGVFSLTYKQRNAVLKGENYSTPVDYWMPFNGNIGLHDATWRSSFGGNLYKSGGSHGCINLPHSAASKIFADIASGTPVLCYHLSGTESKKTSSPAGTPQPVTEPRPTEPETRPSAEPQPSLESSQEAAPAAATSRPAETAAANPNVNESGPAPANSSAPYPADGPDTRPAKTTGEPQAAEAPANSPDSGERGPGAPAKESGVKEIGPGV